MRCLVAILLCLQLIAVAHGKKATCDCSDCQGKMELGIILDSSSSIPKESFNKAKTFLKNFVDTFDIANDGVRVSFVSYGRDVHVQDGWNLNKYNSIDDLEKAIMAVPHHKQDYTNTGGAIQHMREHQLNKQSCRKGVPRVAVIVTDGNSQKWPYTEEQADKARKDGIITFAVGVGSDIKDSELLRIAGHRKRVSRADDYDELEEVCIQLSGRACKAADLKFTLERKQEL